MIIFPCILYAYEYNDDHFITLYKNSINLQSNQTGEALEDVYIEAADAVVGQVSGVNTEKDVWFISSIFQT